MRNVNQCNDVCMKYDAALPVLGPEASRRQWNVRPNLTFVEMRLAAVFLAFVVREERNVKVSDNTHSLSFSPKMPRFDECPLDV